PVPRVLHGAGAGGLPVGERATGVDPPAAAVGNVHGFTENPVRVGLERLAAIQAAVPVPRVLHGAGAGGLPVGELHGALARGVAQVNVDAELRRACLEAVRATLPAALPGAGVVSVGAAGRAAIRDAALEAIGRLSPRAEGRGGTATRLWRSPAP
ncbi:class II fructose-bisphosphate aldolase, partial [Streptomyces sp. NPDC003011]